MVEKVSNELMYEVLKSIQADLVHVKRKVDEQDRHSLDLRHQIHDVQGHLIRIDENMARLDLPLDRIESRLELVDA